MMSLLLAVAIMHLSVYLQVCNHFGLIRISKGCHLLTYKELMQSSIWLQLVSVPRRQLRESWHTLMLS
ncbi:protein of unknown function [Cyanobium sp. NIES-981]|nr:protein of unknown function [Cyanobium sp. NIES-981]